MGYRIAADLTALIHLGFVMFVTFGALLVLRWRKLMWVHIPTALWGAWIELSGGICPLTPLENYFRMRGGEHGYAGGFVDHYLFGLLYPTGLTRTVQLLLGAFVLVINALAYWWIFRRFRTFRR